MVDFGVVLGVGLDFWVVLGLFGRLPVADGQLISRRWGGIESWD